MLQGAARAYLNAGGLGEHSRIRVGLLDEGFRPIPGFTPEDAVPVAIDGLRTPLRWTRRDTLPSGQPLRLDVRFEGVRPEDGKLYAAYIAA